MVVAEYDPLRDEGLGFAARLQAAGVPVRLIDCAGQIHPVFGYAAMVNACDLYLTQAGEAIGTLLRDVRGSHWRGDGERQRAP